MKHIYPYCSPDMSEEGAFWMSSLLCGSMVDAGGTEDLVYDDWSDLTEAGE